MSKQHPSKKPTNNSPNIKRGVKFVVNEQGEEKSLREYLKDRQPKALIIDGKKYLKKSEAASHPQKLLDRLNQLPINQACRRLMKLVGIVPELASLWALQIAREAINRRWLTIENPQLELAFELIERKPPEAAVRVLELEREADDLANQDAGMMAGEILDRLDLYLTEHAEGYPIMHG